MKARILDPQVKVYTSMDENAVSIATLHEGSEIEYGSPKRRAGKLWVPIALSTGQQAFIPGEARISAIHEGALMQDKVNLYSEPSTESQVKQQLGRNTKVYMLQKTEGGGQVWMRVRDMNGSEGYIAGDTHVKVLQQKTKAMARKNLLTGAMWLIAGLAITFSGSSTTSGGSFSLLGYGAILFGAVMLVMGLVAFFTAPA
jgi:uncharacterized protein YgiM (DUF1202 family)